MTAEPALTIRPVAVADTEAIVALWRLVFPEYGDPARPHRDPRANVQRKVAFADGLFCLAERRGRVVGTVMAGYDGHRGWLYSLGVHPEERRGGVGRALVAEAERALAALGCPKVNLQVLGDNREAQAFWRGVGYVRDEVISLGKRTGSPSPAGPGTTRPAGYAPGMTPPEKVSLTEKLALVKDHWHPRVVAALNGQHVKVVKLLGPFTWHQHEGEDELFLVVRGRLRMEFRERAVELGAGELIVVPRGVEHRPVADEEVEVVLFEPAGTLNTGNVREARTVDAPEWI